MLKRIFLVLILSCTLFCGNTAGFAQTPGTSSDPLITKSYLDFFAKFRNVVVKAGSTLNAESGTMLVLVSGQMRVEIKRGSMIIDLSAGRKITNSTNLQAFHLIMIPNGSDCSFKAIKETVLMAMGLSDTAEK